jgi:serine/threonine protein kinase/tetratricopeptide (TPR) repeat protein
VTTPGADKERIFHAAAELNDPAQRAAFLDAACGADANLRAEIEDLLRHDDAAGRFLSTPIVVPDATPDESTVLEGPGSSIGPYKLLQQLGEGGMGTVFLAEQTQPVARMVALKLIKPGMDSRQVLARFEQERQALALMDHPNIARVLDAGSTQGGRPYLVMDLVKGIPITRFCDQEHLTPRERLELLVPVCQAVQHAHQKGIIHRDLKPSNVLIALYDGKPVPKVIDFGVAKATERRLTERTMFTEVGQIVGTIEYMAPEQAELNNLDIDTRADIYALGVLLYELLTGSPPFTAKQLRSSAFSEMLRIIREVEPPRPSTRLSTSEELPAIAANRRLEPRRLTRLVHGDLDWIAMKCLEKERSRRYQTANGLAMDLQRFLDDEPVLAGPPGAPYRLWKAARKHRKALLTAAAFALLLTGAAAVSAWLAVRATRAAKLERLAKETAEIRLTQIEKGIDLLSTIFKDLDPQAEQKEGKTLRVLLGERLDLASKELEGEAVGDKLAVARLQVRLGASQVGLGYPAKAIDLFTKAQATFRAALGADHPDTLACTNNLANAYHYAGKTQEALKLFEETLERRKAVLGARHPATLTSMSSVAYAHAALGRTQDAIKLHAQAFQLCKDTLGPDHPDTLASMVGLANAYYAAAQTGEAITLFEAVLALRRVALGRDHRDTLKTMTDLANCYADAGRTDPALKLREETLPLVRSKLGPDHPDTLACMHNLANSYERVGRLQDALLLREETFRLLKQKDGPDHPNTLKSMNNLAISYFLTNRIDDARALYEETLQLQKARLGPEHPDTLKSMNNLAECYRALGRREEALKLREQTLQLMQRTLGSDHPDTIAAMHNLAISYADAGRAEEAMKLREEKLRLQRTKLGPDHPDTLRSMNGLALNYLTARRFAEAEPLAREAVELQRKRAEAAQGSRVADQERLELAKYQAALGESLIRNGKPEEADSILRQCLSIREGKEPDAWTTFHARSLLGEALLDQKQYDQAAPLLQDGFEGMKARETKIPAYNKARVREALQRLVQLYDAWGKPDQAAEWRKQLQAAKEPDTPSKP